MDSRSLLELSSSSLLDFFLLDFIAKDFDSGDNDEMVYIAIKDESEDEDDKMALISHVSKCNHPKMVI